MKTMPELFGRGSLFFAVGCVLEDGTVREFGGASPQPRTWSSVEAFHKERGKLAGTLITYFPSAPDAVEEKLDNNAETSCQG